MIGKIGKVWSKLPQQKPEAVDNSMFQGQLFLWSKVGLRLKSVLEGKKRRLESKLKSYVVFFNLP